MDFTSVPDIAYMKWGRGGSTGRSAHMDDVGQVQCTDCEINDLTCRERDAAFLFFSLYWISVQLQAHG